MNQQLQDFLAVDPSYEDTEAALRVVMDVSDNLMDRYRRVGRAMRVGGNYEDIIMDDVAAQEANGNEEVGRGEAANGAADEEEDDDVDVRSPQLHELV